MSEAVEISYGFVMKSLAEIADERVKELGVSPIQLAQMHGLAREFILDLINGKKGSVRSDKLNRLAEALYLDRNALASGKKVPIPVDPNSALGLHREYTGKKRAYQTFDPDHSEPDPDDGSITIGDATGPHNLPADASPQLDVTAGMGGGGFTIVGQGVLGKTGLTYSAEQVKDYWRLPPSLLTAMGVGRATDITMIPVQGDSMSPTLVEGDLVIVDTRHRWPSPDGLYALNDAFGGIIVKRLAVTTKPNDDEQLVDVISDNPRHAIGKWRVEDLRIVGRVLRKFGQVQ